MLSINDRHQKNIDNTLIALHFKGNMFYFAVLDIGILYAWNEKVNFSVPTHPKMKLSSWRHVIIDHVQGKDVDNAQL